jgi:hypothetical protein
LSNKICIPGVGITDSEKMDVYIYPNPAKDELRITASTSSASNRSLSEVEVEIYDVFGRKQCFDFAQQPKGEGEIEVDVSHLSAGVYFIRLTDEQGSAVQKFIKE